MGVFPYRVAKVLVNRTIFKKGDLQAFGSENIPEDDNNVLVVMNHTTYYMEAVAFLFHLWQIEGKIGNIAHKFNPVVEYNSLKKSKMNPWRHFINGVARNMGMIYLKRNTDRKMSEEERRIFNKEAFSEIFETLDKGWVIFFPQGTTSKNAPIKRGIIKLIREKNPKILPIKTENFFECFGKKGVIAKADFEGQLKLHIKEVIDNPNQYTDQEIMNILKERLEVNVAVTDTMSF